MDIEQIQQVRRFHRLVTQRAGALEDSYLRRGRPLGEARMIYEIGAQGRDVRDLRQALGLDSGYVSRLLRALESDGLVAVASSIEDGRRRTARLTPQGLAELAAYDERSDALAVSLLGPLDAAHRRRLTAAMAGVERLLRMAAVEARVEPADTADAQTCLKAYFGELAERFETGYDPAMAGSASAAEMSAPAGRFVLARLDGRPVGCGGLKIVGPEVGEIKRVWTAPDARRLGVARKIVGLLEAEARGAGLERVRLDTNRALAEAHALYRDMGYGETAPFNDDPYAHHWFEKTL